MDGRLIRRLEGRRRLGRSVAVAISIGIGIGIGMSTLRLLPEIQNQWGEDYRFFVGAAQRWVDTGVFYQPHQLAGPYAARTAVDVLYPPIALYLFVPFVYAPPVLWWLIPLGIVTWHVLTCRPAWWIWPVIAVLLWLPRTQSMIIWGNTGIWIAAFVALGVRWAGPAALIAVKPTLAPFMLIGAWRRSWWVWTAGIAVASLPFLPLWFDYIKAIRNNVGDWPGALYSLVDYPLLMIPVLAWLARTNRPRDVAATADPSAIRSG